MTPHLSVTKTKPNFEAFLLAPIGDERNGMVLSVLSGLSRLNLDPWDEAERLSHLPRAQAVEALGHRIDQLPRGAWHASDAAAIAGRLVDLLPRHDSAAGAASDKRPPAPNAAKGRDSARLLWLIAAGIAASLLLGLPARVERLIVGDKITAPLIAPQSLPRP